MAPQNRIPAAGLMSRSSQEIARVLESLHKLAQPITTTLGSDDLLLSSQLLFVDPDRHYIVVAAAASEAVNATLLAHPRVSFVSEFGGWHVEFVATDPQRTTLAGRPAIRFRYPEVIVTQQRRREPRGAVPPVPPLRCVADTQGVAPFEAQIVDISRAGIGYLIYTSDITLEPGTVLKGCRIQHRGTTPVVVDLEVRYSSPVVLADGSHAHRSGCVFLNPTKEVMELIESFLPADG
jgi:c-di-GMP-binding flagellar brake protein YcgR